VCVCVCVCVCVLTLYGRIDMHGVTGSRFSLSKIVAPLFTNLTDFAITMRLNP
jgi:hypothetical protein